MRMELLARLLLGAGWVVLSLGDGPVTAHEAPPPARIAADRPLESPPSFTHDVVPLLTRFGCNAGGCHGKLAGQKGFKLSLRGFAPEQDFESLTRESRGRRLDFAAPEMSLLLRKGCGEAPHGGGARIERGSAAYRLLLAWIAAGAPRGQADAPAIARLEVLPAAAELAVGESRQLTVWATYADGRVRDVTWLTRFDSNDPGQLEVSATGKVTVLRQGETAIRAAFCDHVEVAIFSTPFAEAAPAERYAHRLNVVDEHVLAKLAALRIEPSGDCDDLTFLRRASLDLIGTLPTPEEARAFAADTRPDKRARLVDALLERPEWIDYWTLQLADLLQNRKERDHDVRGVKGVRSFHAWLRAQVAQNRPWTEIARDVLLAEGASDANPAVGYYIVTVGEKQAHESEVADSVAQAFLGMRIGCARCHNHPLERFTQDDYYHFVGFFSRVTLDRQEPEKGPTRLLFGTQHSKQLRRQLADEEKRLADLRGKPGNDQAIADKEKQIAGLQKQIEEHLAQPAGAGQPRTGKFLPPRPLDRSELALPAGQDPRQALAAWMLHPANEQFAGAMVNRLWKHFFSVGLIEPVDDLRATNPPSNAALLAALKREFAARNFRLKDLMRLLATSRVYQLSAETTASNAQDARFYSHYYARRLPAEVLFDAFGQVTGTHEKFAGYPLGVRAIQLPDPMAENYFLTIFGRSPRTTACACERNGDVTLSQLLHLQNSPDLARKLAVGDGRLSALLKSEPDNDRVTDELFLAVFCRLPSDAERTAVREALQSGGREEVFVDLLWALLNSQEFAFNH